jgi:geranylgeranyl diphosphate synthase, type I
VHLSLTQHAFHPTFRLARPAHRPARNHDATGGELSKGLCAAAHVVVGEASGDARLERMRSQKPAMVEEFSLFVSRVRGQVEPRLAAWLDARVAEARHRGEAIGIVANGVRQLALRGGKRLRAVLLAAGYEACGGQGGAEAVAPVGVALELFQTYLLVHDDLMDGDDVRRGGPSLPALMRSSFAKGQAEAMSVLAGDLAAAWAERAALEFEFDPRRLVLAVREFAVVHEQVVQGQMLDVSGASTSARDVEAMHALKTASYSVRGPIVMGARLAGAHEGHAAALAAFADPLGVAFQLRDDLLGTFGDAEAMGKPAGSDLRAGKRTALVLDAMRDERAAACLRRVFGHPEASEADLRAAVAAIDACGARARSEGRIIELAAGAREALGRAQLAPAGRALLERTIEALTERRF